MVYFNRVRFKGMWMLNDGFHWFRRKQLILVFFTLGELFTIRDFIAFSLSNISLIFCKIKMEEKFSS